jgi:hypothetical protein
LWETLAVHAPADPERAKQTLQTSMAKKAAITASVTTTTGDGSNPHPRARSTTPPKGTSIPKSEGASTASLFVSIFVWRLNKS